MTTLTDLTTAITAQLSGITGIGMVNGRTRYIADWAQFLDQFSVTIGGVKQVRGWWVTLRRPAITQEPSAFGEKTRTYHFVITGILGFQDSTNTESTFLQLVEAVLDAFDDETTLGVAGVIVREFDAQLMTLEERQFGSVLVHYGEITLAIPVVKGY